MSKSFLGIDLGTSAVKVIRVNHTGTIEKAKAGYEEISPEGWYQAICRAASQIDMTDVVSWSDGVGRAELDELKSRRPLPIPHFPWPYRSIPE